MVREEPETVTTGRAKRSTAGNKMRELLMKAQQEDEEELFKEVEDDEDFSAPQDVRDVFLDEFADTDEEVEMDEEETERQMRKEERRKAKGKAKAIYNPLAARPTSKPILAPSRPGAGAAAAAAAALSALPSSPGAGPSTSPGPSSGLSSLLASGIDPSTMAPSTLVLALRKERREAKRAQRSEARRSTMRASTLKSQLDLAEKERLEALAKAGEGSVGPDGETPQAGQKRKGRKAQHEGGEVRGVRPLTQDELIAAALEEEERNKEALRDWLRKEEEKRELRRVGRKVVRGPRWTWVSRTVGGRLVEDVTPSEPQTHAQAQAPVSAPEMKQEAGAAPPSNTSVQAPELPEVNEIRQKGTVAVPEDLSAVRASNTPVVESKSIGGADLGDKPETNPGSVPISSWDAPTAAPMPSTDAPTASPSIAKTSTSVSPTASLPTDSNITPQPAQSEPAADAAQASSPSARNPADEFGSALASASAPAPAPDPTAAPTISVAISSPVMNLERDLPPTEAPLSFPQQPTDQPPAGSSTLLASQRNVEPATQDTAEVQVAPTSAEEPASAEPEQTALAAAVPPTTGTTPPTSFTVETAQESLQPQALSSATTQIPQAPAESASASEAVATVSVSSALAPPSEPHPTTSPAADAAPASLLAADPAPSSASAHASPAAVAPPLAEIPTSTPTSTPASGSARVASAATPAPAPTGPYMRNYIILNNVPGGLAGEMRLILGDHVDWDQIKHVPGRLRPLNRKPTLCPLTGLPARYRHPRTNIPYATAQGYKAIDALLDERYVWSAELGAWMCAEEAEHAEGVLDVQGWAEAVHGGWNHGARIGEATEVAPGDDVEMIDDTAAKVGEGEDAVEQEEPIQDDEATEPAGKAPKKGKPSKGKRKRESMPAPNRTNSVASGSKSKSKKARKSMK